MCKGTPIRYEHTVWTAWPGQGGGCSECVRVHRYTVSKQSGRRGQGGEEVAASVYGNRGTL